MKSIIFILTALCLSHFTLAGEFVLDSKRSSIGFSVKHLNLLPVKGKFTGFSGKANYDAAKDETANIHVKIDVDTIDTQNDDRDAHLKSKDFFHVRSEVYDIVPENRYIEFKADGFSLQKSSALDGSLKILKTEKKVNFQITKKTFKNKKHPAEVEIQASGKINRQDFGLTWQKPSSGLKEKIAGKFVGDEVMMTVKFTFVEQAKTQTPNKEGER